MISKLLIKTAIARIANHKKFKNIKKKRKHERRKLKRQMIKMFGKTRYYLSFLFGSWVLYTVNRKFYNTAPAEEAKEEIKPPEYQKFYKTEQVAERYKKMLTKKYRQITMEKAFDEKGNFTGYFLYGAEKIEQ